MGMRPILTSNNCSCQTYVSGAAPLVCTTVPDPPSEFEPGVYIPRPVLGWESIRSCTNPNRTLCEISNREPFLQLKVMWSHKPGHGEPWSDGLPGAKEGKLVNNVGFDMGSSGPADLGVPARHYSGGIEGRMKDEYGCTKMH